MTESYPSNSRTPKPEPVAAREPVLPVVTGPVLPKDKTLSQKFSDLFIAENIKTAAMGVVVETLIPAAKETFMDVLNGIGERTLGISIKRTGYRGPSSGYKHPVSYSGMFRGSEQPTAKGVGQQPGVPFDLQDFVIEDRGEAQLVLEGLSGLVERYEQATLSDFYSLLGRSAPYTYSAWGWNDIREATIRRIRGGGGYILDLPRPIHLKER